MPLISTFNDSVCKMMGSSFEEGISGKGVKGEGTSVEALLNGLKRRKQMIISGTAKMRVSK